MSNRQHKTVVSNTESNLISFHQRVPQDTNFGPFIFHLRINGFNEVLTEKFEVVQYADDTVKFCEADNVDNALQLLQE